MAYTRFEIAFETEEKARAWGDSMIAEYHPMAYGTRIEYAVQLDGTWRVTRYMSDSAD